MNTSRRHAIAVIGVLILCAGLSGCTSMGSLEPPGVTLVNLKAGEVTLFETSLVAELRITNPNLEPLAVEGAAFKLYLEGGKVGTGVSSEVFTVEKLDSYVVTTTFRINNAAALVRLRTIFEAKNVDYGVKTTLYTKGPFGTRKIKAHHEGVFDLESVSHEPTTPADEM